MNESGEMPVFSRHPDGFVKEAKSSAAIRAGSGGHGMPRRAVLDTAKGLICGDRAQSYGNYETQMHAIATAFCAITGKDISPADVSTLLQLLKMRRMQTSRDPDSAIDLCGYAALHAEFFLDDRETPTAT